MSRGLLLAALLLALAACAGAADAPAEEVAATGTTPADAAFPRTVAHALGETTIPERPERIVSLAVGEITDTLIALGHPPVGSVTYDPTEDAYGGEDDNGAFPPALAGKTEGIEPVGIYEADLEKIAALQPDLIIGEVWSVEAAQEQLAAIAPTVAISEQRDWKVWITEIGDFIGAEDEAERVLAEYEARTGDVGARLPDLTVSLARPRQGMVWVYGPPSNAGAILTDLGLEMVPIPEGSSITDDTPGAIGEISAERIPEITGDAIFVITYNVDSQQLAAFQEQPLWQSLPAVQAGRVYPVQGTAWTNHGPLGAHRVIDEVESALTGAS